MTKFKRVFSIGYGFYINLSQGQRLVQLKKLIQFQGCWLAIVFGQAYGLQQQGFAVAALLFAWVLLEDSLWKKELVFGVLLGVGGWSLDCALVRLGLFSFPQFLGDFAPYWMIALWLSFSLGLEDFYVFAVRGFRGLRVLMFIGAILGPVSYYASEEFGLVFYSRPLWLSLLLHGMLWAVLFPGIVLVKFRFKR